MIWGVGSGLMRAKDTIGLEKLLAQVLPVARLAGQRILEVLRKGYAVRRKQDKSPLTTADLAAHQAIVRGLGALNPTYPVLSEESPLEDIAARHRWPIYWLVDPLDGTREFLKGNGEFSVNIALIQGHRPVLGVVHMPVADRLWKAARGLGAWRLHQGSWQRIHARRLPEVPVIAGSHSHARPCLEAFLKQLGPHKEIRMGSVAKACLVAEGSADLYPRFGPTSEWDTAAAQCILEEASGRLIDFAGHPLRYNQRDTLENPPFLALGDPQADWLERIRAMHLDDCTRPPEKIADALDGGD